jgi:hypothetical protein
MVKSRWTRFIGSQATHLNPLFVVVPFLQFPIDELGTSMDERDKP